MQKKTKSIILAAVVLVVLLISAVGIFFLANRKEPVVERKLTDIEWYDENTEEFVITTAQELYDLIEISKYYDFSGQTIKLGADIVVNEGNATDWGEKAPAVKWFPIDGFAGKFDGQGHTISGIYGRGIDTVMGMFANTKTSSSFKNFKLLNSYFETDGLYSVGSIIANGCGNLDKIYSDAIVTSNGENAGGLIGCANADGTVSATAKNSRMTNCWFDGEVILTTKTGRYGGGLVGRIAGGTLNMAHCLNTGTISSESQETNGLYVGGLFGALTYTNYSGAVVLDDCLNVGKIEVTKSTATGSVAGGTLGSTTLKITNTFTTEQSYNEVCSYLKGSTEGGVPQMNTDYVIGEEWYRWTTLNYDTYWTVVDGGTPILRCFADEVVDTSGIEKAYNLDWYDETAYEMVIRTKEDLYGLALMSYATNFEGKIVTLGNDIVANEGKASDWAKGKNLPNECWLPIGRTPAFMGVLDGKGYTISGLYGTTGVSFYGLVGWLGTYGEVKNISIKNSLFETTNTSSGALGSIAGRLEGKIDTVYSDATINSVGGLVGGIAGYKLTDNVSKISNAWYDGTLNMIGDLAKNTGGIMGRLIKGTIEMDNCLFSGTINMGGKKRTINTGGFIGNIAAGTVTIKNSLNSGELVTTEAEKVNASGRVFGQVADVDTITITFENAYVTDKGGTYFWYCAGKKPVVIGGAELKEEKYVSGYNAYSTTGLDFSKYWSVVVNKDSTPILKSFAKKSPSVAGLTKTFDKSWYDHNKTTYVLNDAKDLYGFLYLSNSKIDFAGKTVKLGKDIVVNAGNAADWAAGKNLPGEVYNWGAIGKYTNFQGTFDGQGHTISGLYGTTDTAFMGLFGWTGADSMVKNLKITNSYFESTAEGSAAIGSVAGRLEGDVHTVYSDAIITTHAALNGGIAGYKNTNTETPSTITNCWYNGTINMIGDDSKFTGGMMGRIINGSVEIDNCLFSGTFAIGGKTRSASTGGFVGIAAQNLTITNSLNSGQHIVTEAEKMNSVGRVIGQISNSDSTKVVLDNTYFTDKSGTYFWYCAGDKPTIIGGAEAKKEADVMGYNGYRTTGLDFDKYWAVVVNADGTPILKSFASTVPSVAGLTKTFDKSWYDPDKTTYVLNDKEDLYGLLYLSNSKINFKGKTITLGNDITVNTGSAEDWAAGTATPENVWVPIGKDSAFEGTFDGKGKTISGIYQVEDTSFAGLFGWTGTSSEIKNLRLTNSYFESTETGSAAIGSIAGRCEGDITGVYSDAIITTVGALNGGIAGYRNSDATSTISNCWYAGTINMVGDSTKMTGGMMGRIIKGKLVVDNCLYSGIINIGGKTRSASTGAFVGGVIDDLVLTNSLNTGTFAFTDVDKVNSVGRVIGQIESSKNTDVTVDNVYFTDKGSVPGATYQWYRPAANGEYLSKLEGNATPVAEGDVTGEYAYYYADLDYEKYWALVMEDTNGVDGTPILQSFATAIPALPTPPSYADISWYDKNETDYTIYDSADLFGLAYLSKTGVTFEGKTVTIADSVDEIKVNTTGTAAEWAAGTATPEYNWEPIGKRTAFAGTFDGNGKTISGLYGTSDTPCMGLFGQTAEGSTIKNLKLTNSYFTSNADNYGVVGSIVAHCGGNLEYVYSDAIISTPNQIAGGLIGRIWSKDSVNLKNCWFDGSVTSTNHYTAGIVAWIQNGAVTMDNCLNSGTVHYEHGSNGNAGGFCANMIMWDWQADKEGSNYTISLTIKNSLNVGQVTNGTQARVGSILGNKSGNTSMAVENVYATNESYQLNSVATPVGRGSYTGTINMVNASDITGEVAYFNMGLDYADNWALVKDATPVLKYFAGETLELPQAPEGADISWYNGAESTYTLSDKEDLYGFAYLSEKGMNFAGKTIELEKDITVNAGTVTEWEANDFAGLEKWNPIGTIDKKFAGTFDGKGHSIKGIYISTGTVGAALFRGTTANSGIKNLKLENSYISASGNFAGSFVGSASGNLTNLYSNAKIVSTKAYTGGIVGQTWTDAGNDIVISGCWFDGTISAPNNTGGILAIGSKGNVELINCLNTGNITYTTNASSPSFKWVGGLVGRTLRSSKEWEVTEDTTATMSFKMTNCLNLGELTDSKDKRVGSALGQNNGPSMKFTNVYTTNESYAYDGTPTSIGRNNSGAVVSYGGISLVAESAITVAGSVTAGNVSTTLSGLDFTNVWMVGEKNTPVLQWVADKNFDTSWYDAEATTYTISTVEDLYGVQYLSELGVTFEGKTITLGADIDVNEGWTASATAPENVWTPIGTNGAEFAGTFNGNYRTIKGIYVNISTQGAGLFRSTAEGSTIKNLKLENSYIKSTFTGSYTVMGSIAAVCSGDLENVYSNAIVVGPKNMIGGLVGQVWTSGTVNITNCWFAGQLTVDGNAGGIVGVHTSGKLVMKNCLNTGSITYTDNTGRIGGMLGRTFRSTVKWDLNGTAGNTLTFSMENCLNVGQIANGTSGYVGSVIGQIQHNTVTSTVSNVYATNESYKCSGTSKSVGTGSYSGTIKLFDESAVKGANAKSNLQGFDFENTWEVEDGKTPVLQWLTLFDWYDSTKDTYTINTAKQLQSLATLVATGETFAGKTITLGADIVVNEGTVNANSNADEMVKWTPIGTSDTPFAGIFDGNGKTISGLYIDTNKQGIGLFGETVTGSVIKNLTLENSYFKSSYNGYAMVGSVVGLCAGDIINVCSSATVVATKDGAAGIVAQMHGTGTMNLTRCMFTGSASGNAFVGGIVAAVTSGKVVMSNCLNDGTVSGQSNRVGGLCGGTFRSTKKYNLSDTGFTGTLSLAMEKCLNTGQVSNTKTSNWTGSVIGAINHLTVKSTINAYATKESYMVEGEARVNTWNKSTGQVTLDTKTIPKAALTVGGNVAANDVLDTLKDWGFDTTIWTVGTDEGSMPELVMEAPQTTVSLFSRVAKAIVEFVTN